MKVRDVIKLLEARLVFGANPRESPPVQHSTKSGTVTVSGKPSVDVPAGTLNIMKQAGLK